MKFLKLLYKILFILFAFFFYYIQLIFLFFHFSKIAKSIFLFSNFLLLKGLGIKIKIFNEHIINDSKCKNIYISNHDSPLDILVFQLIFKQSTITTAHSHLRKILPFINETLINCGHFTFNHKLFSERCLAYRLLINELNDNNSIFLFPSGSLVTSIFDRFSNSVINLSYTHKANIIPCVIRYRNNYFSDTKLFYKPFLVIYKCLLMDDIYVDCLISKAFSPLEYQNKIDLKNVILSTYRETLF